jgi:endonuclease YncB( thermonuclease family)
MINIGSKTFTKFLLCRFKIVIIGGILLSPTLAFSVDFDGQIIRVADGDTLTILSGQEKIKVRLAEIDAPEKAQPFGQQSKQSLSDLCLDKPARIEDKGRDRYGRTIGRVWCAGVDANAEQVQQGMAWVYDRYMTDRSLYALQSAARLNKRGLWSELIQVRPWEWRKEKKLSHLAAISL